jgi:predicted TPR repeat methyltransferase
MGKSMYSSYNDLETQYIPHLSDLGLTLAQVYDTDGNILQALDSHLVPTLLTQAFTVLSKSMNNSPITITELGAGTGRNTSILPSFTFPIAQINALDLSPAMLAIAHTRYLTTLESNASFLASKPNTSFYEFDALNPSKYPEIKSLEGKADLVLSTLVLEHLPLTVFFETVSRLVKRGGVLVLTNMHAEMGRISQAGFVDTETGEKIRGRSYVYEIEEVLEEGRKWGFSVMGDVVEKDVNEDDIGKTMGERGRKWISVRCWFGCVMRFENGAKNAEEGL